MRRALADVVFTSYCNCRDLRKILSRRQLVQESKTLCRERQFLKFNFNFK